MDKTRLSWVSEGKKIVTIHIGEFFASSEPVVVNTILGSCVSACLYDPGAGIGGMNHILVPGKASFKDFNAAARFGINAMELLINAMMTLGADRSRIKAKVFGGAHVLPGLSEQSAVGQKNAEFVVNFLNNENIGIECKDLGGYKTRKIFFHTDSARVFLKRSHTIASHELARLEQEKLKIINRKMEETHEVTWFTVNK